MRNSPQMLTWSSPALIFKWAWRFHVSPAWAYNFRPMAWHITTWKNVLSFSHDCQLRHKRIGFIPIVVFPIKEAGNKSISPKLLRNHWEVLSENREREHLNIGVADHVSWVEHQTMNFQMWDVSLSICFWFHTRPAGRFGILSTPKPWQQTGHIDTHISNDPWRQTFHVDTHIPNDHGIQSDAQTYEAVTVHGVHRQRVPRRKTSSVTD